MVLVEALPLSTPELTSLFLALAALLLSAHFFGRLFQQLRLPRVIGEIAGGVVLGPTILGYFSPLLYNWLFLNRTVPIVYSFGLVLLMFVSGFDVKKSFSREDKKIVTAILAGSTGIPFFAGWLIATLCDCSKLIGKADNKLAFQIVFAVAVAVTSIPVITKIFLDLDLTKSRFAKIVLTTAIIHDVILYVALSIATGVVDAKTQSLFSLCVTVATTFIFFAGALVVLPKFIQKVNNLRANLLFKSSATGYSLFICFLFTAVAGLFNINIVFGAFVAGIIVGIMPDRCFADSRSVIKKLSLAFFIPCYFAIVGLKLDLIRKFDPRSFIWFLIISSVIQFTGTILGARAVKRGWLSSVNFAVVMNARGGPGIVLASIAFDLGIISESFFTALVLTAILTSLLAGFWLRFVVSKGWELLSDSDVSICPEEAVEPRGF
jgi:Kef-type K+ transport system membrane component KefB